MGERSEVPMVRQFDVRSTRVDTSGLVLEAPLAINFNDKHTAFAGTLASLCTLSGWAMTSLICKAAGLKADIAAMHSERTYARPCTEEKVRATCAWPAGCDCRGVHHCPGEPGADRTLAFRPGAVARQSRGIFLRELHRPDTLTTRAMSASTVRPFSARFQDRR